MEVFSLLPPLLMKGNGFEAQHTSKDQTVMERFVLEGPQLCGTVFCFSSYTIRKLRNKIVCIG